ncbi:MAG: hypothetical protein HOQ34_16590, partial [Gemmatimonadaceae bacterium]|nr:hypothetical protein [Gemmatimonadaceae bacterium]
MLPPNAASAAKLKRRKDDAIIMAQFDIQTYVARTTPPPAPPREPAPAAPAAAPGEN